MFCLESSCLSFLVELAFKKFSLVNWIDFETSELRAQFSAV